MRRVVQLVAYITCTVYGGRVRKFSATFAVGSDGKHPDTQKAGEFCRVSYELTEFLQSQQSGRAELSGGRRWLATVLLAYGDPAAAWRIAGCSGVYVQQGAALRRVRCPVLVEQPDSNSPLSNVGLDGGDVWSGARVNKDEIRELVDEATSTTIKNPIIRQYFPGRRWLWSQWTSTVVRRTLPVEVKNMVLVALVCQLFRVDQRQRVAEGLSNFLIFLSTSIHLPSILQCIPQFSWSWSWLPWSDTFESAIMGSWQVGLPQWGFLEGVERTWQQMAAISFFLLSFFLSQSYALWRSVYIVARQVQSKINDFLLLCATYAQRNSTGSYTKESEVLLDTLARYVRLWHMLLYASATRRFAPLKTPQGLNALFQAGVLTSAERDRLIISEGHDTVMGWLSHLVDRAVDDQILCTSATRRTDVAPIPMQIQLQQTLTELRSSYARLRDELTGRMPLSYVQLMQILTDLLIFFTPFAFLHNGLGAFGNMFATAVVTLFYSSVVTLAKLFLDPLNNEFERVKEKAIDKARKKIQRIEERERERQRRRKERSVRRQAFVRSMPFSIESRSGPAWKTVWNDFVESVSATKQKLHRLYKGKSVPQKKDIVKEEKQMVREQQAKDQVIAKILEKNKQFRGDPGIAGIEVATLLQEINLASEGWKKKLCWVPEAPWREPRSQERQADGVSQPKPRSQERLADGMSQSVALESASGVVSGAVDADRAQDKGSRRVPFEDGDDATQGKGNRFPAFSDALADRRSGAATIHQHGPSIDSHVSNQTAQHRLVDTSNAAVTITTTAADHRPSFNYDDDEDVDEGQEADLVAAATAAAQLAVNAAERLKKGMQGKDITNTTN